MSGWQFMNKLSAERILTLVQIAVVPVLICLMILGLALQVARAASDEAPSMELLEFLGEFETKDGGWIDPFRFLGIESSALESEEFTKVKSNEDSSND